MLGLCRHNTRSESFQIVRTIGSWTAVRQGGRHSIPCSSGSEPWWAEVRSRPWREGMRASQSVNTTKGSRVMESMARGECRINRCREALLLRARELQAKTQPKVQRGEVNSTFYLDPRARTATKSPALAHAGSMPVGCCRLSSNPTSGSYSSACGNAASHHIDLSSLWLRTMRL